MKLSLIVPAHNEQDRIAKTLESYSSFFSKIYGKDFEIVVILNACSDNTLDVVKKMESRYNQIRHLNYIEGGKGFALIEGFKHAKGEIVGFTDADGSTSAKEFFKIIQNVNGFDGAIGSRWIKGSKVMPKQPLSRRIAGRAFYVLVRILFGLGFKDTQCGAKVFKRDALKKILPHLRVKKWAFDIDLLYQAKREKLKVKEVPIEWKDEHGSKLKIFRTSYEMGKTILKLRLKYSFLNLAI